MNELLVAAAIVIAGTLIAVRASARSEVPAPAAPGGAPAGTDDILPSDEDALSFATVVEVRHPRLRVLRAMRLGAALVLVGGAVGLLVVIIVRAIAILWPKMFPTTG